MKPESAREKPSELGHSLDSVARRRSRRTAVGSEPHLALDELSDDELAGAAAVGDQEAFGILVARMSPILLRYLRRMVDDPAIAEDLAQETLLDAWKSLPDFAFRSTFRTWMFAIAHRRLADHLRRRRDIPTADERFADLAAPEPMPAEQVITTSLVDALRSELTALPSTSRSVWWLREVEGLALVEISRVLQISVGSVRGHLQRSRKYLSTRLEPWRPGAAPRDDTSQGEASDDHQDTHRRGARA